MRFFRHFKYALALAVTLAATPVLAQTPTEGDAEYLIFVKGQRVGREQAHLGRVGTQWVITATGASGDTVLNRFELKYTADWHPIELKVETTQGTRSFGLGTSFGVTTAINEITQNGTTNSKTDQISARAIVLPNGLYSPYEALAARLVTSSIGTQFPIYIVPQGEINAIVRAIVDDRLTTANGVISARRYEVVFQNPTGQLTASITVDEHARFVRLEIPASGLVAVRSDAAGVATRAQSSRNPTDGDVTIPAEGFTLAGTVTTPAAVGRLRHPAVILVAGTGQGDRDETVAGVPVFSQLAGALAERGFIVLRYDKRGVGQSGGRIERVTLDDYAGDVRSAVNWFSRRSDVDPRRLAVLGHGEGAAVAMLAASRESRIKALVLVNGVGTTGADLVLEQQRHQLDLLKTAPEERDQKIALQKRIQAAVVSGTGWEGVPPELRRQAETELFRTLLLFDPAKVMPKIKQPILIVHGDLDTQVPPHHSDTLSELAKARKDKRRSELIHVPEVNHILLKAKTGEAAEYATLPDKAIVKDVSEKIANWLTGGGNFD